MTVAELVHILNRLDPTLGVHLHEGYLQLVTGTEPICDVYPDSVVVFRRDRFGGMVHRYATED